MASLNRRTVLAGAVGLGAAGFGTFELLRRSSVGDSAARGGSKPNILVVVVDQMRFPQWFPAQETLDGILPNLARLRQSSVSFERYYTASNQCAPSRGVMLTGLYSHQTRCLFTGGGPNEKAREAAGDSASDESTLSPRFPTWGSMLREHGYQTWWYGKWHLGQAGDTTPDGLDSYGFAGGTFPSPNGSAGEGLTRDPGIVDQFSSWFDQHASSGPWCTTVSLVNPHDIYAWPRWREPDGVSSRFNALVPNFETPEQLASKPGLQRDYQGISASLTNGVMPFHGVEAQIRWSRQLDVYLWLQEQVDAQIGRILDTLATRPDIDRNTVVVFTSDHGEYGGSHGLMGKGGAAYEEALRVPLYIRDPRGTLTPRGGITRDQLLSSADFAPLLLTIGSGSNDWRTDPRHEHLRTRADIAAIAHDATEKGRSWIAHASDDLFFEEVGSSMLTDSPAHVIAVRTPAAKYAVYTHWLQNSLDIDGNRVQEFELYDYSTEAGQRELDNQAGRGNPLETRLQALYNHEVLNEVRAPLPARLAPAQDEGFANLLAMAKSRKKIADLISAQVHQR